LLRFKVSESKATVAENQGKILYFSLSVKLGGGHGQNVAVSCTSSA